ncbi:hypothetical protein ACFX2I_016058 [Malus domestica]
MFKSACPRSCSYAYNDVTSKFTCSGADYIITFCPSTASKKSARDTSPTRSTTNNGSGVTTTTSTVNNGRGSAGGSGTTAGELPRWRETISAMDTKHLVGEQLLKKRNFAGIVSFGNVIWSA